MPVAGQQTGKSSGGVAQLLDRIIRSQAQTSQPGTETYPSDGTRQERCKTAQKLEDFFDLTTGEYADLMSAMEAELMMEEDRLATERQAAALADYE
eukprot:scaffold102074_cov27-Prasinocladus_malaysianus.AAC.1